MQIHGNLGFADGLLGVARSAAGARNFPPRPPAVAAHDREYWTTMAEGAAGRAGQAPTLNPQAPPRVWDYSTCMEVCGRVRLWACPALYCMWCGGILLFLPGYSLYSSVSAAMLVVSRMCNCWVTDRNSVTVLFQIRGHRLIKM